MRIETPCRFCGEDEDWHHPYTPYAVPEDCLCNPRDWANPDKIPAICADYKRDEAEGDGFCAKCEHEPGCHRVGAGGRAEGEAGE